VRAQHRLLVVCRCGIRGKTKDEQAEEPRSISRCHWGSSAECADLMMIHESPPSRSGQPSARQLCPISFARLGQERTAIGRKAN